MNEVAPKEILKQVAEAVPDQCLGNIIIIGSLAVGYHFFRDDGNMQVRTKDIDCVLYPRITAVESGQEIARKLLESGWRPREDGDHGKPGNASTPEEELPVVRLYPPNAMEWFIELLTVPDSEDAEERKWTRLELPQGHYCLPSFKYLSIATFKPIKTEFGFYYARPEMMVFANLLEHPEIKPDLMSGLIENRRIKRSNKDLGRVLAIAWLSPESEIESWPDAWIEGLKTCFPKHWKDLAAKIGDGLRMLLSNDEDLSEAFDTCRFGLLSSKLITLEKLRITGQRLIKDAIEPFERNLRIDENGRKSGK